MLVERFLSSEGHDPDPGSMSRRERDAVTDAWLTSGRSARSLATRTGWNVERYGTRRDGAA